MIGFIVTMLNMFELLPIVRAEQRVHFVKLLSEENADHKALKVLYIALKADYCRMLNSKGNILFRYTLDPWKMDVLSNIENINATYLKRQDRELQISCNS